MDLTKTTITAFGNKLSAQLDEATVKINEFKATTKGLWHKESLTQSKSSQP